MTLVQWDLLENAVDPSAHAEIIDLSLAELVQRAQPVDLCLLDRQLRLYGVPR